MLDPTQIKYVIVAVETQIDETISCVARRYDVDEFMLYFGDLTRYKIGDILYDMKFERAYIQDVVLKTDIGGDGPCEVCT